MGPIEQRLQKEIKEKGTICLALIDSENFSPKKAADTAKKAQSCGVNGILVGGSTAIDQMELSNIIKEIKNHITIPVMLFPGNVTGVSPYADAILFISLLNSDDPYFITGAQALGALLVKKYNLEAIPVGYIVIGDGGAIGFVGKIRKLPPEKPNLAAMYALAAQYMGMRFVYLEAGSGVETKISARVVKAVKNVYEGTIIAGGGIRKADDAREVAEAGADVIVVGTLLEYENFENELKKIVNAITKSCDV